MDGSCVNEMLNSTAMRDDQRQTLLPHTAELWRTRTGTTVPAARALRAVVDNVLEHPSQLRYRRLNAANKRFCQKIGDHNGARAVLVAAGFELQSMGPSLRFWVLPSSAVDVGRLRQIRSEIDLGLNALGRMHASSAPASHAMSATLSVAESDLRESASIGAVHTRPAQFLRQASPSSCYASPAAGNEHALRLMQLQLRARSAVMRVRDEAETTKRQEGWRKVGTRLGNVCVLFAAMLLVCFGVQWYSEDARRRPNEPRRL